MGGGQEVRSGQDVQERQTNDFRRIMIRQLEEAVKKSGCRAKKPAAEVEERVYSRSQNREEYCIHMARLVEALQSSKNYARLGGRQGA